MKCVCVCGGGGSYSGLVLFVMEQYIDVNEPV